MIKIINKIGNGFYYGFGIGVLCIASYLLISNRFKTNAQYLDTKEVIDHNEIIEPIQILNTQSTTSISSTKIRFPIRFAEKPTGVSMGDLLDNAKEDYRAVPRLIKAIKKYGIVPLDYCGDLDVDIARLVDNYENALQKQAETNPKSGLELELFQMTNPMGKNYYTPQMFYKELVYLLRIASCSSDLISKRNTVARLMYLALGYAREEGIPPRDLQLPLFFAISNLGYSPIELKAMASVQ